MKGGGIVSKDRDNNDLLREIPEELAIIPVNDAVVFPYMLIPLLITDGNLIRLVDEALAESKIVGVCTQIDSSIEHPGPDDIFTVGCAILIQKMSRLPEGHVRIIGQGLARIEIATVIDDMPFIRARTKILTEPERSDDRTKAMMRNVVNAFMKIIDTSEGIPDEIRSITRNLKSAGRLADVLSVNLSMEIEEKQKVLEIIDPAQRLAYVYEFINNELEILRIGEKIKKDVRREMDREQREYYLRQQMKVIQRELGDEDTAVEMEELKIQIEKIEMPEIAQRAAMKEWNRLQRMSENAAEYSVARTYIDWILELPWEESTEDVIDIEQARKILNRDHYDLDQVKERILEFLSVKKLMASTKGSILCFVGPPGVGKTSLGRSIASALGRKFIRISLGGVKDEAEIRGHRRTYIGALPGRVIQGIRTAGSNNPVFMLDEIDKLGSDFRGDPSSALLEVLDPEHNRTFEDHYINLPFDLSRVMFITTANVRDTIPDPLLDRMEVLDLPGYIGTEKIRIARRYLIPRQFEDNGISKTKLNISDDAVRTIVERYTREAGVRELERKIAGIARKTARKLVEGKRGPYRVTARNIKAYLGPEDYPEQEKLPRPEVGVATGMAKSRAGGVILFVEALKMSGQGKLKMTGHLGEVMKESAEAALSYVKARFSGDSMQTGFFEKNDIHLHIPAGAVPKDGPSAGIAIATALASLALERHVRNDVAMTGEVTLTGKILPVGSIKDKVIAAHRAGIKEIILPASNKKDLEEIPGEIKRGLTFSFVDKIEDGIAIALDDRKSRGGARTKRKRRYARI